MNLIPQSLTALSLTTVVPTTTLDAPGIVGIMLEPTDGDIRIGGLDVTTSTGTIVYSGGSVRIPTKHPSQWGVVAVTGTVNVRRTLLKGTC